MQELVSSLASWENKVNNVNIEVILLTGKCSVMMHVTEGSAGKTMNLCMHMHMLTMLHSRGLEDVNGGSDAAYGVAECAPSGCSGNGKKTTE